MSGSGIVIRNRGGIAPSKLGAMRFGAGESVGSSEVVTSHWSPEKIKKHLEEIGVKDVLTKEVYLQFKDEGKADKNIYEQYGLNVASFYKLKKEWGLVGNGSASPKQQLQHIPDKDEHEKPLPNSETGTHYVVDIPKKPDPAPTEEANPGITAGDAVNQPIHYTQGGIECIDAIESAVTGLEGMEAVCTANVVRYVWRWKHKNGVEDLRKARWYMDRLIALHDGGES